MPNGSTLNGWFRKWAAPSVIIVLVSAIVTMSIAWATMGTQVKQTSADVEQLNAKVNNLDEEYMPRGELIQRLKRIEDRQLDQKEDLKSIKRALGVR